MKISGRKGAGCLAHNNRHFISSNVDSTRTHLNHTFCSMPLELAYEKCFGEAFRSYNNSVRSDRRFKGTYLEKLKQSKRTNKEKPFYEWVVQVGNCSQTGYTTSNFKEAERVLAEYLKTFVDSNPQFCVFNAVLHRDESTPHLHINYIPVAYYEKGQTRRNSLTKCLEQMGYERGKGKSDCNTIAWEKNERERLREIARLHGFEIEDEHENRNKHLSVVEYKRVQQLGEEKQIAELVELMKKEPKMLKIISRAMKVLLGKEELFWRKTEKNIHNEIIR